MAGLFARLRKVERPAGVGRGRRGLVVGAAMGMVGALMSVAGVWAAGAQAAAPEYGRCVKVVGVKEGKKTVYNGGFTEKTCVKTSSTHTGKFEWEPGVVKAGFTMASKPGAPILLEEEGKAPAKVTCKTESGSGTITGAKTVGSVIMRFTGCESAGEKCTKPGLAEGELETNPLKGVLGWQSKLTHLVALAFSPEAEAGTFMTINCSFITSVRGAVLVRVLANKMGVSSSLPFLQKKGNQQPSNFEGGENEVLRFVEPEEVERVAGLQLTTTQTNEEAIEINAFV